MIVMRYSFPRETKEGAAFQRHRRCQFSGHDPESRMLRFELARSDGRGRRRRAVAIAAFDVAWPAGYFPPHVHRHS
jgi:hypothetical protein